MGQESLALHTDRTLVRKEPMLHKWVDGCERKFVPKMPPDENQKYEKCFRVEERCTHDLLGKVDERHLYFFKKVLR